MSHSWSHPYAQSLLALARRVDVSQVLWVCLFALNQRGSPSLDTVRHLYPIASIAYIGPESSVYTEIAPYSPSRHGPKAFAGEGARWRPRAHALRLWPRQGLQGRSHDPRPSRDTLTPHLVPLRGAAGLGALAHGL